MLSFEKLIIPSFNFPIPAKFKSAKPLSVLTAADFIEFSLFSAFLTALPNSFVFPLAFFKGLVNWSFKAKSTLIDLDIAPPFSEKIKAPSFN